MSMQDIFYLLQMGGGDSCFLHSCTNLSLKYLFYWNISTRQTTHKNVFSETRYTEFWLKKWAVI